jgi:hypothetical protein
VKSVWAAEELIPVIVRSPRPSFVRNVQDTKNHELSIAIHHRQLHFAVFVVAVAVIVTTRRGLRVVVVVSFIVFTARGGISPLPPAIRAGGGPAGPGAGLAGAAVAADAGGGPGDVVNELTALAIARVQLLARLPQALLLGRGRELTTTRRPGATHHRDSHRQALVEQAGVVGERTTQKEEAPTAVARTGQQDPGLRADAELEELIRVLGRSLSQRSGGLRSPQMLGFTPHAAHTPHSG